MDFPKYDPFNLEYTIGFVHDGFMGVDEYIDEWDTEYAIKETPESPYKTIDEIKNALLKIEITFEGAWEFLIRFFGFIPSEASVLIRSWTT